MAKTEVAIVKRSLDNSPFCGDACAFWETGGKTVLCVVDGLGHGQFAEKAATGAVEFVSRHLSEPITNIFSGCNDALRGTRGAAMGISIIDEESGKLIYAGIGNTRALILGEKVTMPVNNYGIVGGGYRKLLSENFMLRPDDLVIMYTDGIKERMDLSGYDRALFSDIHKLAGRIMKDWSRATDDAAVMVYRKRQ